MYVIICTDKPNSLDLRLANRSAHLEYAKGWADRMVMGGPFLSEDGNAMLGSMLVLAVDDRSEAEAFAANDPYALAGLFENVVIRRYKKVLP